MPLTQTITNAVLLPNMTACVAGLPGLNGRSNTQQTGTTRYRVVMLRDVTSVQFIFCNYYKTGTNPQETATGNSISIKAAIEYNGTTTPITFAGQRTVSLPSGGMATSDVISIALPNGATPYIRTYWDAGAGGYVPSLAAQTIGSIAPGGADSYVYGSDSVDATGALANATPAYLYGPSAILGNPPAFSVGVCGDSTVLSRDQNYGRAVVGSGTQGYLAADGGGWPSRALRQRRIGLIGVSFGSERALDFAGANIQYRLPLIRTCSHWLVVYGRNDLVSGIDAATLQARLAAIAQMAAGYGIRPIAATIPPKSSDSSSAPWATTTGQTTEALNSVRTAVNDWLRGVPSPFVACVDVADAVETARNSGVWNVGPVQMTGIASGGTSTTLTIAAAQWTANQYSDGDRAVRITGGTGAGQTRRITGNTATALTVSVAWTTTPDATSVFEIFPTYTADGTHPSYYAHYLMSQVALAAFGGGLP